MILNRIGSKRKIAQDVQVYFPEHTIYCELFFGAGGLFFNKPKAKYNLLNDNDSEVFNFFQVVTNNRVEFENAFKAMPIHVDLWNFWKANEETDPIKKALRFLFLSNFGYMGKPETLRYLNGQTTERIKNNLEATQEMLFGCEFLNCDFREFLKRIPFKKEELCKTFIYADSPYLDSSNSYSKAWNEVDSLDLFDVLEASGCKYAMSEFAHPFIIEQAKKRKLNVINLGERQNLKNRKIEVLITNYLVQPQLFTPPPN